MHCQLFDRMDALAAAWSHSLDEVLLGRQATEHEMPAGVVPAAVSRAWNP